MSIYLDCDFFEISFITQNTTMKLLIHTNNTVNYSVIKKLKLISIPTLS